MFFCGPVPQMASHQFKILECQTVIGFQTILREENIFFTSGVSFYVSKDFLVLENHMTKRKQFLLLQVYHYSPKHVRDEQRSAYLKMLLMFYTDSICCSSGFFLLTLVLHPCTSY